ncbi:MAG: diaminopimelate epimerase, partial [Acidimicrobiia bacterium]
PMRPVAHLSLGNPHSVVAVDDVHAVDLAAIGSAVPQVNLEIVQSGPERHAITMRVHERGAGITEACGTGASAAAYAALRWGLVDAGTADVLVHMDGGDATVTVGEELILTGPAVFIAAVEVQS